MQDVLIFIAVLGVIVGGVSWMTSGIAHLVAGSLYWLTAQCPGPEWLAPWLAVLAVFIVYRLALMPYMLTSADVDRKTGAVTRRCDKATGGFSGKAVWHILLVGVLDCVLIFVVLRATVVPVEALTAESLHGLFREQDALYSFTLWSGLPGLGKALVTLLLLVGDIVATFMAIHVCRRLFAGVTGDTPGEGTGFLAAHTLEDDASELVVYDVVFYFPACCVLAFLNGSNPHFIPVVICFLLAKTLVIVPASLVSYWLDRRHDAVA